MNQPTTIRGVLTRSLCTTQGTRGELEILGRMFYTLENPWRNNIRVESCIPAGTYLCSLVKSPRFGQVYGVKNVPDRSHILFHAGNTTEDTQGCILLGKAIYPDVDMFIGNSKAAIKEFHELLDGKDFILEVDFKDY